MNGMDCLKEWANCKPWHLLVPVALAGLTSCFKEAKIEGEVFDGQGRRLPGVQVQVESSSFRAETNAAGWYSIPFVPGRITLRFSKPSYTETELAFDIAVKDRVPAEKVQLFQLPTNQGMGFYSDAGFVELPRAQLVRREQKVEYGSSIQFLQPMSVRNVQRGYAEGPYVQIAAPNGLWTFIDNHPGRQVLFRLGEAGLVFTEKVSQMETAQELAVTPPLTVRSIQYGIDLHITTAPLAPGMYAYLTVQERNGFQINAPEMSFGEPVFLFEVIGEATPLPGTLDYRPMVTLIRNKMAEADLALLNQQWMRAIGLASELSMLAPDEAKCTEILKAALPGEAMRAFEASDLDRSESYCRETLKLEPEHPVATKILSELPFVREMAAARALVTDGNWGNAVYALKRALGRKPEDAEAQELLKRAKVEQAAARIRPLLEKGEVDKAMEEGKALEAELKDEMAIRKLAEQAWSVAKSDPYYFGKLLCPRAKVRFDGNTSGVSDFSYAKDGTVIRLVGVGGSLDEIDTETGRVLRHEQSSSQLRINYGNGKGPLFVRGTEGKLLCCGISNANSAFSAIWDAETGAAKASRPPAMRNSGWSVSRDTQRLVVWVVPDNQNARGVFWVEDVNSGSRICQGEVVPRPADADRNSEVFICDAIFSHDGKKLVIPSERRGKNARPFTFDAQTGALLEVGDAFITNDAKQILLSQNLSVLAARERYGNLAFYDFKTGAVKRKVSLNEGTTSRDLNVVARWGGIGGGLTFFDLKSGREYDWGEIWAKKVRIHPTKRQVAILDSETLTLWGLPESAENPPAVIDRFGEQDALFQSVCPKATGVGFDHGQQLTGLFDAGGLVDALPRGQATSRKHDATSDLVHPGIDIKADAGAEVFPYADGSVEDVVDSDADPDFKSLGYSVLVKHADPASGPGATHSIYCHLGLRPNVKKGQEVAGGKTVLGIAGDTGAAFGTRLHLELRRFGGRFHAGWNGIYGVESPPEKKTYDPAVFQRDWINPLPSRAAVRSAGAPSSMTGPSVQADNADAGPVPSQSAVPPAPAQTDSASPATAVSYRIVYGGKEGVNLRASASLSAPVLGAAFPCDTPLASLEGPTRSPEGQTWLKVKANGWVPIRGQNNVFLTETSHGTYRVTWNKPGDRQVSMRTGTGSDFPLVAKIPYGTEVEGTATQAVGAITYLNASVAGWVVMTGSGGSRFLEPK